MNLTDQERIKICQYVDDVIRAIRDKNRESLEKIRTILPRYLLKLVYRFNGATMHRIVHRTFVPVSLNTSGKRRIYTSQMEGRPRLFVFYLSFNQIKKLCRGGLYESWANDFGNKWFITSDNYKFQNIYQLMSHVIAVESKSSKDNHPPIGKSPDVWMHSEALIGILSRHRSIKSSCHVYDLELMKYSLGRKGSKEL